MPIFKSPAIERFATAVAVAVPLKARLPPMVVVLALNVLAPLPVWRLDERRVVGRDGQGKFFGGAHEGRLALERRETFEELVDGAEAILHLPPPVVPTVIVFAIEKSGGWGRVKRFRGRTERRRFVGGYGGRFIK